MKRWTEEEINFLKEEYEKCTPVIEIASNLDRTINSVQHKASRLGFKHPKVWTHEKYIKELEEKCPTMICLDTYINNKTAILHKCLLCDKESMCYPYSKLRGKKCIHCSRDVNKGNGIELDKPGLCYLIYFPTIDLYKVGITSTSLQKRLSYFNYEAKIILKREFNTGVEAMKLEEYWLNNVKDFKINTKLLSSGNTETFKYV